MQNDTDVLRSERSCRAVEEDVAWLATQGHLDGSVPVVSAPEPIFARVRRQFQQLRFNERLIRAYYTLDESGPVTVPVKVFSEANVTVSPGLDALVHVFIGQDTIAFDTAERTLGRTFLADLMQLGMITCSSGECRATVRAEVIGNVVLCTDPVQNRSFDTAHVLNVWNRSTTAFLKLLPASPCGTFLELCCGAGPACLTAAAGVATSACGIDVNPRAIAFAEFNRLLNGLRNVRLECGDLFGSVTDRTFDRIVAHPPYVPVVDRPVAFKDGGMDGERVSAAIIRQLPERLGQCGAFYAYLLLSDRRSGPAEWRVREMLGPLHEDFDIVLVVEREHPLPARNPSLTSEVPIRARAEQLIALCAELEIERILVADLVIRRRQGRHASTHRLAARRAPGLSC